MAERRLETPEFGRRRDVWPAEVVRKWRRRAAGVPELVKSAHHPEERSGAEFRRVVGRRYQQRDPRSPPPPL